MSAASVDARRRTGVTSEEIVWQARGAGPALVLVNGYGATGAMWPSAWVDRLAARMTVVTLDLRGGGRSRYAPTPFTIGDLADDVVAVLDEAGIERATVLGLSMGGMVAQELAGRSPARVRGLVLVGTRPPVPAFTPPSLASNIALLAPPSRRRSLESYYRSLWCAATAPGFADRHPELIDEMVAQTLEQPTPRAGLLNQVRAMSGWAHPGRLARITAPTAVVHGELDAFSPVANGRAIADLVTGASYDELPGVGHLVPLEAPGVLDAAIDDVARRAEG